MSWIKDSLTNSVGRKIVMGLTGLFLIIFLMAHLAGNIPLLFADNGEAFNIYAHFMKHNKLIVLSEVILFAGFFVHIYQGIHLYQTNKAARNQKYAVPHKNSKVSTASKIMGPLGMIILIFLIMHLWDFFAFKYGVRGPLEDAKLLDGTPLLDSDGNVIPDLFAKVIIQFQESVYSVVIYPIAMIAVSWHLIHGFQSAFQSLGWRHKKYTPLIQTIGLAYAIVIPFMFAIIPVLIKLGVTI